MAAGTLDEGVFDCSTEAWRLAASSSSRCFLASACRSDQVSGFVVPAPVLPVNGRLNEVTGTLAIAGLFPNAGAVVEDSLSRS